MSFSSSDAHHATEFACLRRTSSAAVSHISAAICVCHARGVPSAIVKIILRVTRSIFVSGSRLEDVRGDSCKLNRAHHA